MATYTNLASLFTAIADAIRAKTGKTETIVADNFPAEIAAIQTGGGAETVDVQINVSGYSNGSVRLYKGETYAGSSWLATLYDGRTDMALEKDSWFYLGTSGNTFWGDGLSGTAYDEETLSFSRNEYFFQVVRAGTINIGIDS